MTYRNIEIVDNTNQDIGYEKGFSELYRLTIANEARDTKTGDILHFFYNGVFGDSKNKYVDSRSIFLVNGFLNLPGVVCEKYFLSKEAHGFITEDEKYFVVKDSNVDSVKINDLVICKANTSYKFNFCGKELFFVKPPFISLIFKDGEYCAGDNYLLLKIITNSSEWLELEEEIPRKGTYKGRTYYFDNRDIYFKINNIAYYLVHKSNIYLVS